MIYGAGTLQNFLVHLLHREHVAISLKNQKGLDDVTRQVAIVDHPSSKCVERRVCHLQNCNNQLRFSRSTHLGNHLVM